jgi:cation:H+ antiporter
MSSLALIFIFIAGAGVSLTSSWVLVSRLERVGARLGFSEALLGMVAAMAADAPEITASVTALSGGQSRIGAGVILGSNVFNLAALLGLAAILAGGIALHRRVIAMEGVVAVWVSAVCLVVVVGAVPASVGLGLAAVILGAYLLLLGAGPARLRWVGVNPTWALWLTAAVSEEESELEVAIHPRQGRARDALVAGAAVLIVVGASVAMERSGSTLGARHHVPGIVVGGLVLAAVTSLPNAVAAVYLAARGRGAATLSTAMNSNAINVVAGLLLPGTIVGLGRPSGPATLTTVWYLGLTVFALVCAYAATGLRRSHGIIIVLAYLAFVGVVIGDSYSSSAMVRASAVVAAVLALVTVAWSRRRAPSGRDNEPEPGGESTLDG